MKLHFWNGPNFGDQLNKFIFPKIFPDLLSKVEDNNLLCGIGSIIEKKLIPDNKKIIIFGSGMRHLLYEGDPTGWDIRFLRGPLSAKCLSQPKNFISDTAYCLTFVDEFINLSRITKKKYRASLMPYFSYAPLLPWRRICDHVGINYIDPAGNPSQIIKEILSSERVIAGAMHAAIVADICRVPWIRLRMDQFPNEQALTTEFKWSDWMLSVGLETERCIKISSVDIRGEIKMLSKTLFALESIQKLKNRTRVVYQLSKDDVLASVNLRLANAIESLREDYQDK